MSKPAHPESFRQISFAEAMEDHCCPNCWARKVRDEMAEAGFGVTRYSKHLDHNLALVEGWKEQPEEMPEPFFLLTTARQ